MFSVESRKYIVRRLTAKEKEFSERNSFGCSLEFTQHKGLFGICSKSQIYTPSAHPEHSRRVPNYRGAHGSTSSPRAELCILSDNFEPQLFNSIGRIELRTENSELSDLCALCDLCGEISVFIWPNQAQNGVCNHPFSLSRGLSLLLTPKSHAAELLPAVPRSFFRTVPGAPSGW